MLLICRKHTESLFLFGGIRLPLLLNGTCLSISLLYNTCNTGHQVYIFLCNLIVKKIQTIVLHLLNIQTKPYTPIF